MGGGSTVLFKNPYVRIMLALFFAVALPVTLISIPALLRYFGPDIILIVLPLVFLVGSLVVWIPTLTWLVLSIEVGESHVTLRYAFKSRRIDAADVSRVILDPPVRSDAILGFTLKGEVDSLCWIEFKDGEKFMTAKFPNGIKLRMARVLDPERFPPDEK